jgi:hypothetical protein
VRTVEVWISELPGFANRVCIRVASSATEAGVGLALSIKEAYDLRAELAQALDAVLCPPPEDEPDAPS